MDGSVILHVIEAAGKNAIKAAGKDATTEVKANAVREKIAHLCTGLKQSSEAKKKSTVYEVGCTARGD